MKRLEKVTHEFLSHQQPEDNLLQHYLRLSQLQEKSFKTALFGHNYFWRDRFWQFISRNRHVFVQPTLYNLSKKQLRKNAAQQIVSIYKDGPYKYQMFEKQNNTLSYYSNGIFCFDAALNTKFGVHFYLYFKTISNLGTQRHRQFFRRATTIQDIGCFCLTELFHGSNVKGIKTQAHYNISTKQFIINTPNQQAMKFWIGGLSQLANSSIVWAQLYIGKKHYGVHAFVVPLRKKEDHSLLPGVLIGDCGQKNGLNGIDNGFVIFKNVRIPRQNLLNKLSDVTQSGQFVTKISDPDQRFGMQLVALNNGRLLITLQSLANAIMSLTIAIRFSCCRKQFGPDKKKQNFLITYPLTKYRLMPLLAQTIVTHIAGRINVEIWDKNQSKVLEPKSEIIKQIHALSSVLKAKSSWFANETIAECRQMLGGHGYSKFSRLGSLYNENDVNTTWEGDNNVLLQQGAKFILDCFRLISKQKDLIYQSIKFIKNVKVIQDHQITEQKLQCPQFLKNLFENIVYKTLIKTAAKMGDLKKQGMNNFDIWNNSQVFHAKKLALQWGKLILQGQLFIIKTAWEVGKEKDQHCKRVIKNSIVLFALRCLNKSGYGDQRIKTIIENLIIKYCQQMVKDSVKIIDIIAPPQQVIASPFADKNGNGFKNYLSLIYQTPNAFGRVQWWKLLKQQLK